MPVLAPKNDIADDYVDHLKKYIPVLRLPEFNFSRAADYLESWINDAMVPKPLLDVSGPIDCM